MYGEGELYKEVPITLSGWNLWKEETQKKTLNNEGWFTGWLEIRSAQDGTPNNVKQILQYVCGCVQACMHVHTQTVPLI